MSSFLNVGELRKFLEQYPDDLKILGHVRGEYDYLDGLTSSEGVSKVNAKLELVSDDHPSAVDSYLIFEFSDEPPIPCSMT